MTHPPSDCDLLLPFDGDPVGGELRELFLATTQPDPSSADWERVRLAVARQVLRTGRGWRVAGVAIAAGILLAVGAALLSLGDRRAGPAVASVTLPAIESEEPVAVLPMADDDDVEIHTIRGGSWKVAVGEPPVPDRIQWAGAKDVWFWADPLDDLIVIDPVTSDPPVVWPANSQR